MTMTDDEELTKAEAAETAETAESAERAESGKPKRDKASRLEAKAAKLRAAEADRARRAAEGVPASSRRLRVALVAVGAIAVLLAVAVGIGLPWVMRQRALNDARSGALAAAQRYAVDFGSYDYRHLDQDFAVVSSHLTSSFAKDYQTVSASLKQTIVQYKGVSTAKVQGAGVMALHGPDKADVLVFLDQSVSSAQSSTPRIDRNRLQMSLQRRHGTWLIADLQLK